jgi:hypothetical protein
VALPCITLQSRRGGGRAFRVFGTDPVAEASKGGSNPVSRKEHLVSDVKNKVKAGIDKAASKTKIAAGKVVDKTKEVARSAGGAMKRTGQRLRDAGRP